MNAPHSRVRSISAVLVALLLALGLLSLVGGAAVAADDDAAWAVRTASNRFGPDRQNYSYALNPGGTLADAMVVANHGAAPLTLAVYAADGFTTSAGQLDLLTRDQASTSIGAWVHPASDSVTIAPNESAKVPFTLTLPDNATPGDYLGGIITSLSEPGAAAGVNVDKRLGIRIRLRVGGDLRPTMAIENLHLDYSGTLNPFAKGDATLTYTVHNTGNAILGAQQQASLSGPFGTFKTSAGDIDDVPQLLPGESWPVSVPVDGVAPALRLGATVTLTPLLTDASGSVTSLDAIEGTASTWALPWVLLLLVLIVIAAVVALVWQRRRRRRTTRLREDARVEEAVAQALRDRESSDQ